MEIKKQFDELRRKYQKKYRQTDKSKEVQKKYQQKYQKTDKYKEAQKKYYKTNLARKKEGK